MDKKHFSHKRKKDFSKGSRKGGDFKFKSVAFEKATCAYCGEQIDDMAYAISDKVTGAPVHFDCVLKKIVESETVAADEKITYIGQGRFGVVHYPNPRDFKHFEIRRIIQWEERDSHFDWRQKITDTFDNA